MRTTERGFTLIEMILSLAVIGVITAISLPLYNSFLARNDLSLTSQRIAETLRRAQVYARGVKNDSVWSVEIQTSTVTLFRGTSFVGRDASYDETVTLPGSVTASGLAEVQFAKLSGLPNTTGTVTLTTNASETTTVTINAQGMVSY